MGGICTHVAADPGAQEKRSIEGVQRMASGSIKFNPLFPCSISGYAGATLGAKKKQDRFILLPELAPGVLYCGVCDGHAEDGGLIAERAAKSIPIQLAAQLKWLSDGSYGTECGLQHFETRISDVFTDTFTKFQSVLAAEYESQVASPTASTHAPTPLTRHASMSPTCCVTTDALASFARLNPQFHPSS